MNVTSGRCYMNVASTHEAQELNEKRRTKRDNILQKSHVILRSLLIVATPYHNIIRPHSHSLSHTLTHNKPTHK